MPTFAPSRYRSPSIISSSHVPPRPLDEPTLFPLLNSLRSEPAFQAALKEQQQKSQGRSKTRKPSKRRNANGAATASLLGSTRGGEGGGEMPARVPRGGREMRNGDLLAELYRDVGRQKVVASSKSEVGKQQREKAEPSPAALFAQSTGWEGGGSWPTVARRERGSTEATRRVPFGGDLFSMLENPPTPRPILPPKDSTYSGRGSQGGSSYQSTAGRRPLPPIPARSVPDLPSTLPAVATLQARKTSSSYPVHSPNPVLAPLRHSSSFLGASSSPLGPHPPPRTGSSFSHAVTHLKRMLSRASSRSVGSRRMSAGPPSTLSRTRTLSSSFTTNLVASPAEMSSFHYPQATTLVSPTTSPDSNTTRPSLTQSSPRARPRTVFLARDDIDRDLPSSLEARKALLEILREGPPSSTTRPPSRSVNSQPLPSPPPEAPARPPAERLTSMDEPRYWTFNRMASRSASDLPVAVHEKEELQVAPAQGDRTPRPILATSGAAKGRSASGYYSYGSRWDWEAGELEQVGEEEGEKRNTILRIWKGWVKERKGRAAGGRSMLME